MSDIEIDEMDMKRYEELFKKLDRDNNGKIDIKDLRDALGMSEKLAQNFIKKSDANDSGDVSLNEFINYIQEHEKNLRLQFSNLDTNKDGKVDLDEMIAVFKDMGVQMDRAEAAKLFNRMDQDGSLHISYDEWRDFLLLAPSDLHGILKYWRHSTYIDIGEDLNVPDDFTQKELETGTWWRHLVAGALAGSVSRTATAPLDRIKVVLQVQASKQRISDTFKYLLKEGGWLSLWRGNGINVIKIAPESAIKFMAYEQVKRYIRGQEQNRPMSIFERFVAGACAGCIAQTSIYPMEVLKTRLALRTTGQYAGMLDCAKKIYAHEGLRSFYRGYVPNIMGVIPYCGIDLAVYETLKKKYLSTHTEQAAPQVWVLLACGSISSTLGQFCSYPLALVRTRLQAQTVTKSTNLSVNVAGFNNLTYSQQQKLLLQSTNKDYTMTSVFKNIIKNEGLPGLYRGITMNFVKVLPAVSISYVVYEFASHKLGVNMS